MRARLLLSFSLLGLASGCASTQSQSINYNSTDLDYMAKVERAARSVHVQVVWVNPPRVKGAGQTQ